MGRPLSKKFLGNKAGAFLLEGYSNLRGARQPDGTYTPGQKGEQTSDSHYLTEQKSTNRFKINAKGVPDQPARLVQSDRDSLASNEPYYKFSVDGYTDDGTKVFIKKFFNRTVIYTEDGVNKKAPWIKGDNLVTVDSSNTRETVTITVASTDPISIAAPSAFIANLSVGDTIVIASSADLDGDHVVASIAGDGNSFTIETLSDSQTSTSALLLKKFPGAIIFDFKNAAT